MDVPGATVRDSINPNPSEKKLTVNKSSPNVDHFA